MDIHLITDYLSILFGFQAYLYLNKNKSLENTKDLWYVISGAVGALFFSRFLASLENPYLFLHPPMMLYFYANKTIVGAIVGGIIGVEIYKYFNKLKINTGDTVTIPLMIGIIIGRIGCQLKGVSDGTIGIPCNYFWCLKAGDQFYRHPLPLYEICFLLLIFPFLYWLYKNKIFPEGFVFRIFVVLYFMLRFFLEFLKDVNPVIFGLSAVQVVCLVFSFWYVCDIIRQGLYNPVKTLQRRAT